MKGHHLQFSNSHSLDLIFTQLVPYTHAHTTMRFFTTSITLFALTFLARAAPLDESNCPGYCIVCQPLVTDPLASTPPADTYLCGCKMQVARCSPKPLPEMCTQTVKECRDGSVFRGCDAMSHVCIEELSTRESTLS